MIFFELGGLGDVQALSQLNFGLYSEAFLILGFVNKAISLDIVTKEYDLIPSWTTFRKFDRDLFIFQFAVFTALVLLANKFIIFLNDLTWDVSCSYRNWEVHGL